MEKIDQYEHMATMYKMKYMQAKRKLSGEKLKTVLRCIEMKYESVTKAKKMHNIEYQRVKGVMGWTSPPLSENSLSDNSVSCDESSNSSDDNTSNN
jgi:hypothetical protein